MKCSSLCRISSLFSGDKPPKRRSPVPIAAHTKYWPSGAQKTLLKLLDGKSKDATFSHFCGPSKKKRSLGLAPCSSFVITAKRLPLVSQKNPQTVSFTSTISTGMLRSRIRKISRFVAPSFFLLCFVTRRHKKSPSDCQCIFAFTCVRDREVNSFMVGISTKTSLAGLLSFSKIHTATKFSFGDHWQVCRPSYLSLIGFFVS
mmetsp:Transcript_11345/g.31647  ORF Transcript_11345/g.31647 Transcript_11345/m.31647 type:complete len:202 (-) Transcript_11345:1081-1686(-)